LAFSEEHFTGIAGAVVLEAKLAAPTLEALQKGDSARVLQWIPGLRRRAEPVRLARHPEEGAGSRLVFPGDFPDPTIVEIDGVFWASATSSEWAPFFPLLRSENLIDWELTGYVFPDHAPEWVSGSFWAPELSYENGKVYLCYTARGKDGVLAVAMASADRPEGPYTDHGPLVAQAQGSIDGFPIRDEEGVLYMIWKEDGNAFGTPTPIWAQEMAEDRRSLVSSPVELFRNDAVWEGCLVEGSSLIRSNGYFYMFYAGNGCCGKCCTYATGVARARNLLGPWEKCPGNPVLRRGKEWNCPGHGTVAHLNDRWYLLHHAYHSKSHEFVGRQGLLTEFFWDEANWPTFPTRGPLAKPITDVVALNRVDVFTGAALSPIWQWPLDSPPEYALHGTGLLLRGKETGLGAVLGQHTFTSHFVASTYVEMENLPAGTLAGVAIVGDSANGLALLVGAGKVLLQIVTGGVQQHLNEIMLSEQDSVLCLRLHSQGPGNYRCEYSCDGHIFHTIVPRQGDSQVDYYDGNCIKGDTLPPWDRGLRVGMVVQGKGSGTATFNSFSLAHTGE
jgi:xylan 1,4-beta-xylosidase